MALIDRLNAIGDAIRKKNGTTGLIPLVDMPQAILDIVGGSEVDGGGVTYTNIVYNEDNTIALTDKDGVEHTMECEYTDGKLTSVKYDGKKVDLTYEGDALVKVGKTAIDVANAPKEPLTTIKADSCALETIIANASGTAIINKVTIQADASASLEE